MQTQPRRRRLEDQPDAGAAEEYIPASRSYYNPNLSPSIQSRAMESRFQVNQGYRSKRALGRVQSENDVFAPAQADIARARQTVQAEYALLPRSPELAPFFESNLPSPAKQVQDESNPFQEPLTDFGSSLMDLDEEETRFSTGQPSSSPLFNGFNPKKKRKEAEMDQDDGQIADSAEFQDVPTQTRVFKPVKRSLGKTQSLPAGKGFFS